MSKKKDKAKKRKRKMEHTMLCESGDAPCTPTVTSRTIVEDGIVLPWERWTVPPVILADGRNVTPDRPNPPVLQETGEVFIPLNLLYELGEQDQWTSAFGNAFLLGPHEGLALEAAGFAVRETKGGYHRTDALVAWLASLEEK